MAHLPKATLARLPIDVILLRCHDTIRANSAGGNLLGRILPVWNLVNICIDYREFVARFILRREDSKNTVSYRSRLCLSLNLELFQPDITSGGGGGGGSGSGVENSNNSSIDNNSIGNNNRDHSTNDSIVPLVIDDIFDPERSEHSALPVSSLEYMLSVEDNKSQQAERSARRTVYVSALKDYFGNQLLHKLWYDVNPTMNVPICAMW